MLLKVFQKGVTLSRHNYLPILSRSARSFSTDDKAVEDLTMPYAFVNTDEFLTRDMIYKENQLSKTTLDQIKGIEGLLDSEHPDSFYLTFSKLYL